jgi:cytochrome c oxidase cbb3-type subunit 3
VKPTRDQLLSHEADGIREFDNALPLWWLYGFYFTIAFAAVYVVNYHVLPTPIFGKQGMAAEYAAEMTEAGKAGGAAANAFAGAVLLTDEDNLAKGKAIFESQRSLCVSCHRADLGGLVGPNLTDDRWLHGCKVEELMKNVSTGFPTKGMLPYGSGQRLDRDELLQVVSYVMSRRGSNPPNPKAADAARDKACS